MKIILWPTSYLPSIGGLEVMTHSLATQLLKNGHEVLVIANNTNSEECKEFTLEGIRVFLFPFITSLLDKKLLNIKKIMSKIRQIFDDFEPDLVNVHGWFECFSFYQVRILENSNIPVCITIHGLLEQNHYQTDACLKLWSMANAVNTVSQVLIESLSQQGFHHPALKTIYNGLSIPQEPIQPLGLHPHTLVMVGRLSSEKCFDIAFYAVKNLIRKYPDIKLILVGGGGQFNELSRLKNELGLDQHIEMTDFVKPHEVQSYIDRADLVLVPSYYESFCLVALQAAIRGRPVIASNVYGLKEVVEHNQTGLLIEAKNPQALSEAVDQLLSNPQRMQEMGKASYIRATHQFTIENTTHQYLKMYENIMEQPCKSL
ncbi:MAG: putative glycosyltransferase, group 1 [Gammaproteobacteria bacterium]|jgi:glycosyltransferase involved in cell wall biosynthesis|nr:putative glycosyltransferase, group 1 [Gammaproteobacteria bacterium]